MPAEWKRSTWSFKPTVLAHTHTHILRAIDTALTDAGWALASWSGALGNNNFYLRPDRFRVDLAHDDFGPSGNAVITASGASLSDTDLTGGGFGATSSTKATGQLILTAQPVDGNTFTITDGILTRVFEFDSTGGVGAGRVSVVIGSTIESSLENLAAAINGVGFKLVATPHWHWWYTGDNFYQHCGLHVQYITGSPNRVEVASFLENTAQSGNQRSLVTVYDITIAHDMTKQNDFLFVVGEDGFYVEAGTDTLLNNVAHGMVMAYYPDPTLYGTRDRERTWTAQGLVYELRGNIRSYDRNYRFIESTGDRRNHTGRIVGMVPRGSESAIVRDVANNRDIMFGPREHMMTTQRTPTGGTEWSETFYYTLGLFQSNFDDIYRVSHLAAMQGINWQPLTARHSTGSEVVGTAGSNQIGVVDQRNALRHVPKFAVCSSYLLPWNNIVDKRTGITFRVARVSDGGRNSNLAIVWPDNSNVTTIPATP